MKQNFPGNMYKKIFQLIKIKCFEEIRLSFFIVNYKIIKNEKHEQELNCAFLFNIK